MKTYKNCFILKITSVALIRPNNLIFWIFSLQNLHCLFMVSFPKPHAVAINLKSQCINLMETFSQISLP